MSKTIRARCYVADQLRAPRHNRAAEHAEANRIILEARDGLVLGVDDTSITIVRLGEPMRTEVWGSREDLLSRVEVLLPDDTAADVVAGLRFALTFRAA